MNSIIFQTNCVHKTTFWAKLYTVNSFGSESLDDFGHHHCRLLFADSAIWFSNPHKGMWMPIQQCYRKSFCKQDTWELGKMITIRFNETN